MEREKPISDPKKPITDEDRKELEWLSVLSDKKRGRPKEWNDEAIKEFADILVEYSEQASSITMHSFTGKYRYSSQILPKLADVSPYFREAYKKAKINIGNRREQGAMLKKFEPNTVAKYSRMYDPEYDGYRKLELAQDELIKAQAKIKALEQLIDSKGDITKYLEAQKRINSLDVLDDKTNK